MLGRLKMRILECIEVFKNLSSEVFGKGSPPNFVIKLLKGSTGHAWFDAEKLERVIRDLLVARGLDENIPLKEDGNVQCKV